MQWYLLDAVTKDATAQWLFPFSARPGRNFHVVPAHYDVNKLLGAQTTAALWRKYLAHSSRAWRIAAAGPKPFGFITTFPQLAMTTALHRHLRRSPAPIVAWNFNLGALYGGLKGFVARQMAEGGIDAYVVHSLAEIDRYSKRTSNRPFSSRWVRRAATTVCCVASSGLWASRRRSSLQRTRLTASSCHPT
jgi:hypothetical protein